MAARRRLGWPDSVPLVNPNNITLKKDPCMAIVEWAQGVVAEGGKGLGAAAEEVEPFITKLSELLGTHAVATDQHTAQQLEQQVRYGRCLGLVLLPAVTLLWKCQAVCLG
jgi:hypothetical protein